MTELTDHPVEIRARRVGRDRADGAGGDTIVIEVRDEGDGIPPEDFERIFDKFYRVHAADRQRAGTGLGLAICRGFVEANGGRLLLQRPTGGHGAIFAVSLPAARPPAEPA